MIKGNHQKMELRQKKIVINKKRKKEKKQLRLVFQQVKLQMNAFKKRKEKTNPTKTAKTAKKKKPKKNLITTKKTYSKIV